MLCSLWIDADTSLANRISLYDEDHKCVVQVNGEISDPHNRLPMNSIHQVVMKQKDLYIVSARISPTHFFTIDLGETGTVFYSANSVIEALLLHQKRIQVAVDQHDSTWEYFLNTPSLRELLKLTNYEEAKAMYRMRLSSLFALVWEVQTKAKGLMASVTSDDVIVDQGLVDIHHRMCKDLLPLTELGVFLKKLKL